MCSKQCLKQANTGKHTNSQKRFHPKVPKIWHQSGIESKRQSSVTFIDLAVIGLTVNQCSFKHAPKNCQFSRKKSANFSDDNEF